MDADAGSFVFLEMNTRLQVEHPVTERVTGIDLVEQQFLIPAGEPPSFDPTAVSLTGHALELRVYAENRVRFLPGPGTITEWVGRAGAGLVHAGYQAGNTVTPTPRCWPSSVSMAPIASGPWTARGTRWRPSA